MAESSASNKIDPKRVDRIKRLQEDLNILSGGKAVFRTSPSCPADVQEAHLEDIRAFESVGTGISLFEGLQTHGLDLPQPNQLDESQSRQKTKEILHALADLKIFLVGFKKMNGCEFYRTLWHQTLWEGCYVKKRHPGSITVIDVSHKMNRAEIQRDLDTLIARGVVH
jgi:hypothetical protein